jgi:hypothetical protein
MAGSTLEQRRALASPARKARALMSSARIPKVRPRIAQLLQSILARAPAENVVKAWTHPPRNPSKSSHVAADDDAHDDHPILAMPKPTFHVLWQHLPRISDHNPKMITMRMMTRHALSSQRIVHGRTERQPKPQNPF